MPADAEATAAITGEIVSIKLERGMCYGTCPVYSVELRSDGSAAYHGSMFVERLGPHEGVISKQSFARLAARVAKSGFFDLCPSYEIAVTDCAEVVTTV